MSDMDIATFRKLVAEARAKNPRCCYCGRDLSKTKRVMYMKYQRRIACVNCPEAVAMPLNASDN